MALLKIETLDTDVRLGLWKIEEQEEDLIRDYFWLSDITKRLKVVRSAQRRLEILAIYALLYELTNDKALRITHDLYGCPHVLDYYIGISHTKGFAALILSQTRNVAVDIEYCSDRVGRIAHKFIRNDEFAPTLAHQLINWSAKETVYKYFSEQQLGFFDIRIVISRLNDVGILEAINLKSEQRITVNYQRNNDYIFTYLY